MDMMAYFLGNIAAQSSGGGTSGTGVQSDYLQNDSTAADYIKNRPFYEGGQVKIIHLVSASKGLFIAPLGLQIGEEYLIYEKDPSQEASSGTPVMCIDAIDEAGFSAPMIVSEDPYIEMVEGVAFEDETLVPGSQIYYISTKDLWIQIGSSIKKIDKKFLPDDIATKLKVATSETLGGVMPVSKSLTMTQDVGIDENGRLFTSGVKISGIYDASQYTVPCATDSEGRLWAEKPFIPTTSTIEANSDSLPTSAAVYSFIEELLAEGEY